LKSVNFIPFEIMYFTYAVSHLVTSASQANRMSVYTSRTQHKGTLEYPYVQSNIRACRTTSQTIKDLRNCQVTVNRAWNVDSWFSRNIRNHQPDYTIPKLGRP